jgi:hypothetical protein
MSDTKDVVNDVVEAETEAVVLPDGELTDSELDKISAGRDDHGRIKVDDFSIKKTSDQASSGFF